MVEKVSSTRRTRALGVLNGVAKSLMRAAIPRLWRTSHSSPRHNDTHQCAAGDAGRQVGLLITKGYRACRSAEPGRDGNLFDYFYAKPQPIAPQRLTREIPEHGRIISATCAESSAVRAAATICKSRRRVDRDCYLSRS